MPSEYEIERISELTSRGHSHKCAVEQCLMGTECTCEERNTDHIPLPGTPIYIPSGPEWKEAKP